MLLHRINPEKNEARYYRVEVRSCLASPYAVYRIWGRISRRRSGFVITPCISAAEAKALARQLVRRKIKRGYIPVKDKGFLRGKNG
ncbi:MAG TPA: WGR domain-containing protein [Anaerolineae bacterium]|nr:WGR domain-containing protein [Anaerolineae bacterium]